jgi:hypothetical protein
MIIIYQKDLDGLCSAAIIHKWFSNIGLNINTYVPLSQKSNIPIKNIKINEIVYILNKNLTATEWTILLSKTKNIVWINKHNNLKESTSILTWKFFFGFKNIPYAVLLINDIILKKKNILASKDFEFGIKLENLNPNSPFWHDLLIGIDSTMNKTLNNGKVINSFQHLNSS